MAERRYGYPRTEYERRQRHYDLYGVLDLPPRGTGLSRIEGVDDLAGDIRVVLGVVGAVVGYILGRKKTVSLLAGAALGYFLGAYKESQEITNEEQQ